MPNKTDEEIRKNIKRFEESLPESERNPDVKEDTERLIERAAQPLPKDEDRPLTCVANLLHDVKG